MGSIGVGGEGWCPTDGWELHLYPPPNLMYPPRSPNFQGLLLVVSFKKGKTMRIQHVFCRIYVSSVDVWSLVMKMVEDVELHKWNWTARREKDVSQNDARHFLASEFTFS